MAYLRQQLEALWLEFPAPNLRRSAAAVFSLSVISFPLSVALAQTLFSLAGVLYAIDLVRRPRVPRFPPVKLPLALFAILTVVSVACSQYPLIGLTVVRKLTLFGIMLLTMELVRTERHLRAIYYGLFAGSALAGVLAAVQFVLQYREVRAEHPGAIYYFMTLFRIRGFQGHWMIFGGQQMLIFAALAAFVLLGSRGSTEDAPAAASSADATSLFPARPGWFAWVALGLVAFSILLNFTRGVWLGCGAAMLYLVARWRARWLLALPVAAVLAYFASPGLVRDRVQSLFHPETDVSISVRFEMWHVGMAMIRRHPLVGVGPNNIRVEYLAYLPPGTEPVPSWHQHLHDNLLQLAAERGLPCLAVWLWFMGSLGWHMLSVRRRLASVGRPIWMIDASIAGLLASFLQGFFEFNFGTTAVLMLFLFVVSAPFAAEQALEPEDFPSVAASRELAPRVT